MKKDVNFVSSILSLNTEHRLDMKCVDTVEDILLTKPTRTDRESILTSGAESSYLKINYYNLSMAEIQKINNIIRANKLLEKI